MSDYYYDEEDDREPSAAVDDQTLGHAVTNDDEADEANTPRRANEANDVGEKTENTGTNPARAPYKASLIPPKQRNGHLVPRSTAESGVNRLMDNSKHVQFFGDANLFRAPLRLVINKRHYKSLDALQAELSKKIPELPRGCRAIFTPRGKDRLLDIDQFEDNGNYICSSFKARAKGVDINKVAPPPAFHVGRAKSGRRLYSMLLQNPSSAEVYRNRSEDVDEGLAGAEEARAASKVSGDDKSYRARWQQRGNSGRGASTSGKDDDITKSLYSLSPSKSNRRDFKRVYFRKSGEQYRKHLVVLTRRSAMTFQTLLNDLSDVFQMRVRHIFTLDGRPADSISAIFKGPNTYVCSATDQFLQRDTWVDNAELLQRESRKKLAQTGAGTARGAAAAADWRPFGTSRGNWLVYVKTGKQVKAATTSDLSLTMYGTRGTTEPIPLNAASAAPKEASPEYVLSGRVDLFQPGTTSVFDISVAELGKVFKVRLNSTYSGEQPDYFCDEIRLTDKDSGEILVFPLQRWLARSQDDGEICRELPAVRSGETPFTLVKYRVTVTTGDYWNAGTAADIFLTVYGEHGDSGVRRLWRNLRGETQDKLFLKGQIDSFDFEAVNLGRLKTTVIGHDVHAAGQGWFLERVVITDMNTEREYIFPCGKWLDEGEGDGKIVRELDSVPPGLALSMGKNLWDQEKWKYENGNELVFYSKMTGKPLQMFEDFTLDALGDENDPASLFEVAARRHEFCVFKSARYPTKCLAIENGKPVGKVLGMPGSTCDFIVHVQQDRSTMLENVKGEKQFITVQGNGQLADSRWSISGPSRSFVVYCKGMFRDGSILMFATNALQTLTVNFERHISGLGKRNKLAQFMVHKVYLENEDEQMPGRVRMFSSSVLPGKFLRITPSEIDCEGEGNTPDCEFIVHVHKSLGYVTLESVANPHVFIGIEPDGNVVPLSSKDDVSIRFVPELVKFGRSNRTRAKAVGIGVASNSGSARLLNAAQSSAVVDHGAIALANAMKNSPREAVVTVTTRTLPRKSNAIIEELSDEDEDDTKPQKSAKDQAAKQNTKAQRIKSNPAKATPAKSRDLSTAKTEASAKASKTEKSYSRSEKSEVKSRDKPREKDADEHDERRNDDDDDDYDDDERRQQTANHRQAEEDDGRKTAEEEHERSHAHEDDWQQDEDDERRSAARSQRQRTDDQYEARSDRQSERRQATQSGKQPSERSGRQYNDDQDEAASDRRSERRQATQSGRQPSERSGRQYNDDQDEAASDRQSERRQATQSGRRPSERNGRQYNDDQDEASDRGRQNERRQATQSGRQPSGRSGYRRDDEDYDGAADGDRADGENEAEENEARRGGEREATERSSRMQNKRNSEDYSRNASRANRDDSARADTAAKSQRSNANSPQRSDADAEDRRTDRQAHSGRPGDESARNAAQDTVSYADELVNEEAATA